MAELSVEESYKYCKALNKRFGSTYYWSTALLPKEKRKHVHALYGFCRYADDIVDDIGPRVPGARAQALQDFGDRLFVDLEAGHSTDPVLLAVINTVSQLRIDPDCFRRFLKSMHMDFTIDSYATFDDLLIYMDGSAAVIGEMMLPVLDPLSDKAFEPARQLGNAFQLTNFLRDVGEDLERGRLYIPLDTISRFGADPYARQNTAQWKAVMRYEIERCRNIYLLADEGIPHLPESSARCVTAARKLYSGILDRIEENDYDVFSKRARVPMWRKLAAASKLAG